jgi:hypothetical protein
MKRIFCVLSVLFLALHAHSQEIVEWGFSYNTNTKTVELKAAIKEGWHLYSQYISNDVGPVPTTFSFQSSNHLQLVDAVEEPKPIQKYDENFEAMLDFFEGEVVFKQKINVKNSTKLDGSVMYMVCNDVMCMPPVDKTFSINISKN